jgi:hypothetical protein
MMRGYGVLPKIRRASPGMGTRSVEVMMGLGSLGELKWGRKWRFLMLD